MKNLSKILGTAILLFVAGSLFQSCDRAQANVQTLISNDCGQSWELVQPGQTIPKRTFQCELKTTIPGSPMTGESHFKSTFLGDVKARIDLDYEYIIVDAVKFISEAKYLANTNTDGDEVSANSGRFEAAENTIIDRRIKNAARDILDTLDLVDFDQSEFEDELTAQVNKALEERGIVITSLSFVPEPDVQTAQAIDVATAMRVYESKGLGEVGKVVMANRAGATIITVGQNAPQTVPESK